MAGLVVTAAACTVYLSNGTHTLLYKGASLPALADLADGEVKRLKAGGFVSAVEEPKPAPKSDGPPARNGSRDDWAAYALTLGASEADLDGQTRDYIRDLADLAVASKS
jgi:hypothetical protein